jgi:hypothetical protein
MKILYIGYYRENSDWGRYATNNILALEKAGIDVVCRPLNFSGQATPPVISHLEKKSTDGCDVCIQHVFPEHIVVSDKFKKNIGIFANEFVSIEHSTWTENLDLLDEIWVASEIAKELMPESLKGKTKVVPHCFIKEHYTTNYPNIDIAQANNKFKFYTIADSTSEGLESLLKAFHSEFDKTEQVTLILQMSGQESEDNFHKKRLEIKSKLAINKNLDDYVSDLVIPRIEDQKMLFQLHQYADCFVTTSNQRCLPSNVFDAACFGNTPIVLENTDATNYVDKETHVRSIYLVIEKNDDSWNTTYNSKNFVFKPCEKQLRETMRKIYNAWLKNSMIGVQNRKEGLKKATEFSLQSVGKIMKETLNA